MSKKQSYFEKSYRGIAEVIGKSGIFLMIAFFLLLVGLLLYILP
jgi:hypothetical protein